ncbi:hypothetical protein OEZ86_012246 [Tetradesmus obliquus]|nr:hypothetical protein OEZ86_012246 [Tetradesmus obliquus]
MLLCKSQSSCLINNQASKNNYRCWALHNICKVTTLTSAKALLKKPLKKRVATPVNLTRQQFVQATWALQDVTCAGVYATAKDKNFNNTLALAVTRDFMDVLNAAGWPAAALSVRVVRQPCKDITYNNKTYASFRAGVRFNSTTDTQVRDDMWAAVADPDTASPCTGGYNTTLYKNVAALFAKYSLKVSQNNGTRTNMFYNGTDAYWVEYAGPCLPKPKPIIKAIVVDTPIIGTSCDPAAVEALANGVRATITSGLPTAESALVFVEVIDCKPAATGRRLLASNVTVTLSITTSPLLTTAAQVDAASRALYAAITGKPSSSLPAGASLDTVLQMLNTDLKDGGAADLLVKVQTAIVAANLTAVFDATLTNATQVAGTQQAITCPNMPEFAGAFFSTQCLGQIPGFDCIGSCVNGGTVTASCTDAGTWTIPATASCPATEQPKKECTGVPSTTPEGSAWPTGGCANLARCDATCSGDATGSPFAVCDTVTGAWSAISGSCTPIRCLDSPLVGIAYANWATNCATTVGATCTATCFGAGQATIATCTRVFGTTTANWAVTAPGNCASAFPTSATCSNTNGAASGQQAFVCGLGFAPKASAAGSSIATLDAAAAKAICCDAIYPADATCATSWTAGCPTGSTPNPAGLINGLVVGSTAAQSICCRGAAEASPSPTPPSPSPPPCVPTCSDSTVGQGVSCGTTSNGCGGTCTATCTIFGASSATCTGGVCTCNPTCSGSANNLPVGSACGLDSNGCGSFCSRNCAAGAVCNSTFKCECVPTCNGTVPAILGESCSPLDNSCGGTCPRQCAAGTFCNSANVCQCSPTCSNDLAVAVGGVCGQVPDGCGGFCTKTCTSASDCVAGACEAKVTCGASASGLTGPGTTLFLQTFETNKDNMFGSIQRIGPDAANAFKGSYYGSIPIVPDTAGYTWFTRWGQLASSDSQPSQFPASGKLVTQVAIYLNPEDTTFTAPEGQVFEYTVAISKAGPPPTVHNRDYIFHLGWYSADDMGVTGKVFWVSASHNSVGDPKNAARNPVPIQQAGWYVLQHVFVARACPTLSSQQCLYADMKIFTASQGGACGAVYTYPSLLKTAAWSLGSDDDLIAAMGGARYGWNIQTNWQTAMKIDSVSYRSF